MNSRCAASVVDAAREEPGVEVYSYHRREADTFWVFALMTDQTAMQNHGRSEAMQSAMAVFGPLVEAPPDMSLTGPIAAIGLAL